MARYVSVAVPVPLLPALTYALPAGATVDVGSRVLVPVGQRLLTGCVLEVLPDIGAASGPAPAQVKAVAEVIDETPLLPAELVGLARWVADYYLCGVGDAIAAAMPPCSWIESEPAYRATGPVVAGPDPVRAAVLSQLDDAAIVRRSALVPRAAAASGATADEVRRAVRALQREGRIDAVRELRGRAFGFKTTRAAVATLAGLDAVDDGALTDRQRSALRLLAEEPRGASLGDLEHDGVSRAVVAGLARRGLVTLVDWRVERDPFEGAAALQDEGREAAKARVALTAEQAEALATLGEMAGAGAFGVALLHGVTGSGKTEVYRRLAQQVCAAGRRVLMLVPEIALTPAVAATLRHTFGDRVAIQHSALSEGERHDQWHRIRRGDVEVVVGTRSAVFAPVDRLGLVIVDEEHDTSYKQEDAPRYHGRDVAIVRAQRAGALVVLGSATPALESFRNAQRGRYRLVSMRRRVADRPLAAVTLVNMRDEFAEGGPDVVISRALHEGIAARLARGEQAVVLLNRRGFAASIFCRACGASLDCPNCSVSLTYHRRAHRARCHYCDHAADVPPACPACGGEMLEYQGIGTERVEADLLERFPGVRVARVDRDTVRRRGEVTRVLDRFARRELDVLVGTQMIAKGHDFPAVTLVGVISADVGLGLADFRAGERTFQLLTQVAGRAGRGEVAGEAIVQTLCPEHYSIRLATTQDYEAFFEREMLVRASMRYPPAEALVNVVVRDADLPKALTAARRLAIDVRRLGEGRGVRVVGPAPAPLSRLRGESRAQFFAKGADRHALRAAVREAVAAHPELRRQVTVDVDPLSVL
ncbi:MAG: primosomal protein N' [Vicinamibacterales bacterium]|nr:primosomal protein N' [Vicinamibacterales bacterium]